MTVSIRLAIPDDARVLAQLRYDFRASTAPATEPESVFLERCEAWMAAVLHDARRWRAWVAEASGQVVGNLWLEAIDKLPNPGRELELHAYITNVFVDPAARGGVGTLLVEAALAWCRESGVDSVILWPTAGSRSLYVRHGFAVRDDLMEAVLDNARLANQ